MGKIDSHQPIIPEDDSDVTDTSDVEDSESDIEDEVDNDVPEDPENYFATKDPSVKWKKMIGNRRGRPLAVNIVDANSIGLTQIVPTYFESPLDALNLTLPDDILLLVIRYTNQKCGRYCHPTLLSADSIGIINLSPKRRFSFYWSIFYSWSTKL